MQGSVCLHGSPAARLAMPGKGSAVSTHPAGTRQEERAAHPALPPRVTVEVPRLSETALAAGPALSEERKCLNELDGFSVSRERTGSETGSKTGSRPAGLVLWHRAASVQELSQESSSEEAVTASLSFCHPTQELLGSWTDPRSSSSSIKTALNYLSRIVSTTQVVLIIQCNLQGPPGL